MQPFTDENRHLIERYSSNQSQTGSLANYWLQTKGMGVLEQEAMIPNLLF